MLPVDDLWLLEEPPFDEPADLLTIPEVRHHVAHALHDDDLGLRALLERPETLSMGWRRNERARPRRGSSGLAARRGPPRPWTQRRARLPSS